MHFLQCLVREEAETSIRHNTQNRRGEAPVQRLQALFSGYSHKHMQDVAVPTKGKYKGKNNIGMKVDTVRVKQIEYIVPKMANCGLVMGPFCKTLICNFYRGKSLTLIS